MSNKKLIKLITNDSTANFDNQFRTEIVIKKNSEIALHSLSMVREDVKININGSNDLLTFAIDSHQIEVHLTHGNYSVHNTYNLINEINKEINSKINLADATANVKLFGSYVRVTINYDSDEDFPRLEAQLIRPPFLGLREDFPGRSIVLNNCLINDDSELSKSTDAPNASLNASNAFYPVPFIRGCGSFRAKIKLFVANINPADPNGFIIGLTKHPEKLDETADVPFTLADIAFGISVDTPTSNYFQIVNGVSTDTGVAPLKFDAGTNFTEHDYIDFTQSNNRIICTIFQDGVTQNIFSEPNPYTNDAYASYQENLPRYSDESLYGFIIFKAGQSRVILDGVRIHTGDSNTIPSIRSPDVGVLPLTSYVMPEPQPAGVNAIFDLQFNSIKTASFFGFSSINPFFDLSRDDLIGFKQNVCGVLIGEQTMIFGNKSFTVLDTSDIYMVEMLNIPLDSYEAFTEQRKNVLAVIPVNEENVNQSDNTLQYESPNLNYISIKNDYDFSLRNIRARVVNSRFEPIDTTGSAHLTVFIRDSKE